MDDKKSKGADWRSGKKLKRRKKKKKPECSERENKADMRILWIKQMEERSKSRSV